MPKRDLDWMDAAACGAYPRFTRLPIAEQQKLCAACEVRSECLEYGLADATDVNTIRQRHAVYGGLTPDDLVQLVRDRRRGLVTACASDAPVRVTALLPQVRERRQALIENVEDLVADRLTPDVIAARLHTTVGALDKAMLRAGRNDLARLFNAELKRAGIACDADRRQVAR